MVAQGYIVDAPSPVDIDIEKVVGGTTTFELVDPKSSPTPPPHYHQPTINQILTTSHPNPTSSRRRDRRLGDRRLRQQKKTAEKHHHSGGQETKLSRRTSRMHRLPVTRCHDLRRLMASSSRRIDINGENRTSGRERGRRSSRKNRGGGGGR
ncbi:hypothetical protein LWI29_030646 [Acer saccharum]|uniref:Uncharacterized protein n=1 Tax=Acer saccharum TaxID=4024 RepID=A0AA39TIL7_ACESA|nr:hypothetical protein LWI29_030646 [Acer saccharum]